MFDKFVVYFFYIFLFSRFFSEKLKLLPKWVDILNFPFFAILLVLLFININRKRIDDSNEGSFVIRIIAFFSISFIISVLFNNQRIMPEASFLFFAGVMEGPILFLALDKLTKNPRLLVKNLNSVYLILLVTNLLIIFFLDLPVFFVTGNPDVVSGTYGNNTYQFSMLLMICGGYLLGYNYIKRKKTFIVIISQITILIVFYFTQFRAALPFFLLSYFLMIINLYGRKLIFRIIPILIIFITIILSVSYLVKSEEKVEALRFEDWSELINEPGKFLSYGKFSIYQNVFNMFSDHPETVIIGTGPGNFLSRANYTFSYELTRSDKGVGKFINEFFGIQYPYMSDYHVAYVFQKILPESVLGTFQLSNPYSSYLAPLTEIGVFGGVSIIVLYIFLFNKSVFFLKVIRGKKDEYIPISIALIGGTSYLFMLAFLDNYWEIARVTLPVWLLFWAVKTAAYAPVDNDQLTINPDEIGTQRTRNEQFKNK